MLVAGAISLCGVSSFYLLVLLGILLNMFSPVCLSWKGSLKKIIMDGVYGCSNWWAEHAWYIYFSLVLCVVTDVDVTDMTWCLWSTMQGLAWNLQVQVAKCCVCTVDSGVVECQSWQFYHWITSICQYNICMIGHPAFFLVKHDFASYIFDFFWLKQRVSVVDLVQYGCQSWNWLTEAYQDCTCLLTWSFFSIW